MEVELSLPRAMVVGSCTGKVHILTAVFSFGWVNVTALFYCFGVCFFSLPVTKYIRSAMTVHFSIVTVRDFGCLAVTSIKLLLTKGCGGGGCACRQPAGSTCSLQDCFRLQPNPSCVCAPLRRRYYSTELVSIYESITSIVYYTGL